MSLSFDTSNFHLEYCKSGSLQYGLFATLILGTICFILTKVTHEYSWVDRLWSLLPGLYATHLLFHKSHCEGKEIHERQWLMYALVWVWGLRLTFNFVRKGGYKKGGEDYRWEYLRRNYHPVIIELLNFFFTAYYQLVLIYLFSLPIYFAGGAQLKTADIVLAIVFLILVLVETTADNQQWAFQQKKKQLLADKKPLPFPYSLGFITTGLFKYSRHPNFFAEQAIWWVYALFTFPSIGSNNSWIGAFLLTVLFQGSTALTEKISTEKYPAYKEYQKATSRIIPMPATEMAKQD